LEVHQRGALLQFNAERAVPVAEGSYRWRGGLRPWDKPSLAGTGQPTPPSDPGAPCTSPSTSTATMPWAAGSAWATTAPWSPVGGPSAAPSLQSTAWAPVQS